MKTSFLEFKFERFGASVEASSFMHPGSWFQKKFPDLTLSFSRSLSYTEIQWGHMDFQPLSHLWLICIRCFRKVQDILVPWYLELCKSNSCFQHPAPLQLLPVAPVAVSCQAVVEEAMLGGERVEKTGLLISLPLPCFEESVGMCSGEQQVLICKIRSFLPENCLKGKPEGSQQQNYFLASKVFLSKASLNPWSIKAEKTNREKNGMKLLLPK